MQSDKAGTNCRAAQALPNTVIRKAHTIQKLIRWGKPEACHPNILTEGKQYQEKTLASGYETLPSHEGLQHLWNAHCPVLLLIGLQDGHDHSRRSTSCGIQGVGELCRHLLL